MRAPFKIDDRVYVTVRWFDNEDEETVLGIVTAIPKTSGYRELYTVAITTKRGPEDLIYFGEEMELAE